MIVVANGRETEIPEGSTLGALLEALGVPPRYAVVERNGVALARGTYDEVVVAEGDRIEIVRAIGGGQGLATARLYLVTPSVIERGAVAGLVAELAAAGVDMIQLREKEMEAGDLVRAGEPLAAACRAAGIPFIVNDRPDVALALSADGVHLGQNDIGIDIARRILGDALVGRSTHSPTQIETAVAEDIDYLAAGPVFETPTKAGREAAGIEVVGHAARRAHLPWFAIGGIDASNLPYVVEAGARRVVVVRAITEVPDPVGAAARLRSMLDAVPL